MTKNEFINAVLPGAIKAYKKYNILPSLTMAQAVLESAWGKSAPGHMLFGIKWTPSCGYDWQLLWTTEYYNGVKTRVKAKFRKYNSYTESIEDHSQLLLKPRYAKVLKAKDYKEACQAVYKAGYATDPNYPNKLISLIETYNLNKWDDTGGSDTVRYEKLNDIPESFQPIIKNLMDAKVIAGDGSDPAGNNDVIDLSHDQVRTLIFLYRGGAFDRKLIAMGMEPVINQ